jgi:hypothetical protein
VSVEFGTLVREDGRVVFRELPAERVTALLKAAEQEKKDDEGKTGSSAAAAPAPAAAAGPART